MVMTIEEEIKQKKFKDEFQKAEINLFYTANWRTSQVTALMKPFGISPQQFNILRILRGQRPQPAPLKLLTERMLDRMSNTSRLVDKLMQKGLVTRDNCMENRRRVDILITEEGLRLCEKVTKEIESNRELDQKITEKEAQELNRILDKMRS